MKLAFLLLVHRYPEQAIHLINTLLKEEEVSIYIHVDAKSDDLCKILRTTYKDTKRVHFTEKRYRVYWGSYNQIKATAELIKTAHKNDKHDYYTLISGQDFPIKPLKEFKKFLKENDGKEYIISFTLPRPENWGGNGGMDRLEFYWIDAYLPRYSYTFNKINGAIHRMHKILKYKRKLKYQLYGGGNWFSLSNTAVTFLTTLFKENPSYIKRYKFTRCADEIVIQTILMNSPLKENIVSDDLRYANWATGPEYPKTLRIEDYDVVANSKNKFFGRKFDAKVDETVISKFTDAILK